MRTITWPADTLVWTTYRRAHFPSLFNNSVVGDARFSPLAATADGGVPAVVYLARTMTVSLLETAFHDVHATTPRRISVPIDLAPRGTIELRTPQPLTMVDLRDDALERLGLQRGQLVSTTPAHYACTRAWAERLVWRHVGAARPVGLLWRSRVAELAQHDHFLFGDLLRGDIAEVAEVAMVIAQPHTDVPTDLTQWYRDGHHLDTLHHGVGRSIIDDIASTYLNATIVDP